MSIVATEVESIHGAVPAQRMIFYKCQDHLGEWHNYGPVITVDPWFDIKGFKPIAAAKVENLLAEMEFNKLVGEE